MEIEDVEGRGFEALAQDEVNHPPTRRHRAYGRIFLHGENGGEVFELAVDEHDAVTGRPMTLRALVEHPVTRIRTQRVVEVTRETEPLRALEFLTNSTQLGTATQGY